MRRRWLRAAAAAVGITLIGTALLMWRTAEQALPPAPVVHRSAQGGMAWCLGAPADCGPPVLPGETVAVIAALAMIGVALVAAVLVDTARQRGSGTDGPSF